MFTTEWGVEAPAAREWRTLRDLYLRADDRYRHDPLVLAVADADEPARVWSTRFADMLGPGRLALFVRDAERRTRGFVSAYRDGQDEGCVVILRTLLVVPSPKGDSGARAAHLLLDHAEDWAAQEGALTVLCEVDAEDHDVIRILEERGYTSGVTRAGLGCTDDFVVVEWSRTVGQIPGRMTRRLFAVA